MKFLKILLIIKFIIIPSISYAKSGKGELKLDKRIMELVMMYMYGAGSTKFSADAISKNDPLVMAVSTDGRYAWYMYCPSEYRVYGGCMDNNTVNRVKKKCEKTSNGVPCFTFAKKRKVTWKNGGNKVSIKRSDLKDPYLVAKKIQDAGFYDGDLMDLPGIDYKTGQLIEDKNISGKKNKKNNVNLSQKTNSSNIVQEIKELKKLLDEGVITEKEFTQAKNKILNDN